MNTLSRKRQFISVIAVVIGSIVSSCAFGFVTGLSYDPCGSLTAKTILPFPSAPEFPFSGRYVIAGTKSILAIGAPAIGVGPFYYQWQFSGTNILGATNDSFFLPSFTTNLVGNYQVIISNSFGSVTSQVFTVSLDTDNNGLADSWEIQYFSHTGVDPNADADGDGISNFQEYLDGTNPTNAASFKPRLNVTIAGTSGTVSQSPLQSSYTLGQAVQITAIPDPGQSFIGWFGNVTSTSSNLSLVLSNNVNLIAEFGIPLPVSLDATNASWITSGNNGWYGQTGVSFDGVSAAQSGVIYNGQQSVLQTTLTNIFAALTFEWQVSERGGSSLNFYGNGTLITQVGNGTGWQSPAMFYLSGTNTLAWKFAKGASDTNTTLSDAAWLDQVKITPLPVAFWGDAYNYTFPVGLTNVVAISAGYTNWLALKGDGTVVGWGDNTYGQTNVPQGLSNVTAIAAGGFHNLALKGDGSIAVWGANGYGQTNVPSGFANVLAIAPGGYHSMALRSDGTVAAWGAGTTNSGVLPNLGQSITPANLFNVTAIAGGTLHSLALKSDGTVIAWGNNGNGQTNVPVGLTNVVDIAAGGYHSLALKSDGTIATWGYGGGGLGIIPTQATNGVAIAAGATFSAVLRRDGKVLSWGYDPAIPVGLANVTSLKVGWNSELALLGTSALSIARQPASAAVTVGSKVMMSVGVVGSQPIGYQWQFNGTNLVGATNAVISMTGVQNANAGNYTVVATNSSGSVTSSVAKLTVLPLLPVISSWGFSSSNGQFSINALGAPGYNYVLEASTNLVNWLPLQTNIIPFGFVDTNASKFQLRFYRTHQTP